MKNKEQQQHIQNRENAYIQYERVNYEILLHINIKAHSHAVKREKRIQYLKGKQANKIQ